MASRFSRRDAKCRTEADHRATYRADHSLCVNWVTVQANEAPRHEAMRSVPPIVSSSRCVGRLRISDSSVETVGMLCATSRATIRMNLKTSPGIRQPKSHRFVLTATAQAASESA
jgi:hypothetical protein